MIGSMKKFVAVLKSIFIIISAFVLLSPSVFAVYENDHINTGDRLEDIIAVAQTQLGYLEGSHEGTVEGHNDCTKYGAWYGLDNNAWCAMFVSWCADQADVPVTVIPKHASCDDGMGWFINLGRFSYSPAYGGSYSPKRGDIVYFGYKYNGVFDSTHVGIVYKADAENIHVIEGNSSDKVQTVTYNTASSYILGYGKPYYDNATVVPEPGSYVTTATSLNFRKGPDTSYTAIALLPQGTLLDITEVDPSGWGKAVYNGSEGWVSMTYCIPVNTITYDANGGEGVPKRQVKYLGQEAVISDQIPTRSGYAFAGWSLSANGSVTYKPGDKYSGETDITLYAQWERKETYTLTYNANGGTGAPNAQSAIAGTAITISGTLPTRQGYEFTGWSESQNGGAVYKAGDKYTGDRNITLYACWQIAEGWYKVSFNANGGTGAPSELLATVTDGFVIGDKVPSRQGYSFQGWALSANSQWGEYFSGDKCDPKQQIILYAVWAADTPQITVKCGTGGRVYKSVSGNSAAYKIKALEGYSISHLCVDSEPQALVGDTTEITLTLNLSSPHNVEVAFSNNSGLWINPFDDVSVSAWYYSAVEYCYTNNIMSGMTTNKFGADASLTRCQFVTVIGRLYEADGGNIVYSSGLPFKDLPEKPYYYDYLCWAYENKLVSGISADSFSPDTAITREQLCVMLRNYAKFCGADTAGIDKSFLRFYSDSSKISVWAEDAVAWAVYNGYINGYSGALTPFAGATRAQAAKILMEYFK